MAVRTALLTSRNINLDTDFSKYIETVSEPGVITGLAVTASAVATGQAWVPCERTNGETIYAFVQNFNSVAISGNGYVIISIPQNIVDNGGGNEDGTGIATIEVVNELPAKNYLQLATISSGTVTDTRNMIPTVWELKTDIDSINEQIADLDYRVDKLENTAAIDHLEERALVWEKYALTNTLFKQITPALADCTVEANVWDTAANTEIHIQRQGSGTASNKLKIKIKKTGSPADLVVQVRKGIEVDVSSSEAYWYGDSENIIATGSVTASTITTSFQELTVTLDAEFGGTEWELLDIVLKQNGGVNASNYYVIACDSTQRSECFSYVSVNWSTRSRSKLMPYAVSDGFAQFMLAKVANSTVSWNISDSYSYSWNLQPSQSWSWPFPYTLPNYVVKDHDFTWDNMTITLYHDYGGSTSNFKLYFNNTQIAAQTLSGRQNYTFSNKSFNIPAWSSITNMLSVIPAFIYLKSISMSSYYTKTISKTVKTHKSKPRELKAIWEEATGTLYGYHTDGKTWYIWE